MSKTSLKTLSAIAVVSLAGVQAGIRDCMSMSSNCTGYFYNDINAAFVECFNSKGVITNREEQFFEE